MKSSFNLLEKLERLDLNDLNCRREKGIRIYGGYEVRLVSERKWLLLMWLMATSRDLNHCSLYLLLKEVDV